MPNILVSPLYRELLKLTHSISLDPSNCWRNFRNADSSTRPLNHKVLEHFQVRLCAKG
uniref:Uncharacterized protein n=1 Tax=Anguilla anguilla TaxID=7936 RepID=A0A0E9S166_ANGAN